MHRKKGAFALFFMVKAHIYYKILTMSLHLTTIDGRYDYNRKGDWLTERRSK